MHGGKGPGRRGQRHQDRKPAIRTVVADLRIATGPRGSQSTAWRTIPYSRLALEISQLFLFRAASHPAAAAAPRSNLQRHGRCRAVQDAYQAAPFPRGSFDPLAVPTRQPIEPRHRSFIGVVGGGSQRWLWVGSRHRHRRQRGHRGQGLECPSQFGLDSHLCEPCHLEQQHDFRDDSPGIRKSMPAAAVRVERCVAARGRSFRELLSPARDVVNRSDRGSGSSLRATCRRKSIRLWRRWIFGLRWPRPSGAGRGRM